MEKGIFPSAVFSSPLVDVLGGLFIVRSIDVRDSIDTCITDSKQSQVGKLLMARWFISIQ
ncbi:hypothetical protein D3C86_1854440 [compost metagenome]